MEVYTGSSDNTVLVWSAINNEVSARIKATINTFKIYMYMYYMYFMVDYVYSILPLPFLLNALQLHYFRLMEFQRSQDRQQFIMTHGVMRTDDTLLFAIL